MSALQKGETVLITGATGWIGSHILDEVLKNGLNAKIAIRDQAKADNVIGVMEKLYGKGRIEMVTVPDLAADGAFDQAILNVQGVIHTATDMSFSNDPEKVVPPVLNSYKNLLEAAASQKSIRRVIVTSSSSACGQPRLEGEIQHFNDTIWNEKSIQDYKTSDNAVTIYCASKALSEKFLWDFIKEKKPNFVATTILPNANFGRVIPGIPVATTGKWIVEAASGYSPFLAGIGSQYHVDVDDVAMLHVIALMREDVKNERILAFGTKYNYNSIIDSIKKVKPDAPTGEKKPENDKWDNTIVDVKRANELLKETGGLHDLDYSIARNLQGV